MDYFKALIITDEDNDDIWKNKDVIDIWNSDVEKFRSHMIKQYNNDEERATDKFCLKIFLNWYSTAINVFDIHSELNHKKTFNQLIEFGWLLYNDKFHDDAIDEEDLYDDDEDYLYY